LDDFEVDENGDIIPKSVEKEIIDTTNEVNKEK
jgi:hypothetical protein